MPNTPTKPQAAERRRSTFSSRHPRLVASVITLISVLAIEYIARSIVIANGSRQCVLSASNLRDIGQGLMIYANDNNGHFPRRLGEVVFSGNDLFSSPQFFLVPWSSMTPPAGATPQQMANQINGGGHCSYEYFMAGKTIADATPGTIMACENDGENPTHKTCVLFGDGRVELLSLPQIIQNFRSQVAQIAASNTALTAPSATAPAFATSQPATKH